MKNIKINLRHIIAEEMYIFLSMLRKDQIFGSVVFGCATNETLCSLFLYLCDRECTQRVRIAMGKTLWSLNSFTQEQYSRLIRDVRDMI